MFNPAIENIDKDFCDFLIKNKVDVWTPPCLRNNAHYEKMRQIYEESGHDYELIEFCEITKAQVSIEKGGNKVYLTLKSIDNGRRIIFSASFFLAKDAVNYLCSLYDKVIYVYETLCVYEEEDGDFTNIKVELIIRYCPHYMVRSDFTLHLAQLITRFSNISIHREAKLDYGVKYTDFNRYTLLPEENYSFKSRLSHNNYRMYELIIF